MKLPNRLVPLKSVCFYLLFFYCISTGLAQSYSFQTKKMLGAVPRYTKYILPLEHDYSYLIHDYYKPADKNKHIVVLDMQNDVSILQRMRNAKMTRKDSLQLDRLNTVYSRYQGTLEIKNYLVLQVFDSIGYRYITPDLNHDFSFFDDAPFVFDLSKEIKVKYQDNITNNELKYIYEGVFGDSLKNISVGLEILPYNPDLIPKMGKTKLDYISVKNNEHVSAKVNLQGQDLIFEAVSLNYSFGVYEGFYYHIYDSLTYDSENKQILTWNFYTKEPFELNSVHYSPRLSLFGDTLTLTVMEGQKQSRVYNLDFIAETVQGGSFDFSSIKKNKYTVIDFWGTWCPPCMKSMPQFNKLSKKYKDVFFLGLAVDNNIEKVKSAISSHRIGFPVVHEQLVDGDSYLHTLLGVSVYPQYIIFNSEKRIVFRTSDVEELSKFLKNAAHE